MEKFIGWVPCVAGKLFFKHITCDMGEDLIASINHIEFPQDATPDGIDAHTGLMPYNRYVLLSSIVNWQDTRKENGHFQVLLTGAATNSSGLEGSIFVVHKSVCDSSTEWKKINSSIKELNVKTIKADNTNNVISIGKDYSQIIKVLNNFNDIDCYKVTYSVDRHGFAIFKYVGEEGSLNHKFTVVRQAFYYLKYSIHLHQHHKRGDDSLTTIHVVPANKEEIGEQLIDDLKESMVSMKRDLKTTNQSRIYDTKGVMSYAKSLIESCKKMGYMSQVDYCREIEYINNMHESIKTMEEKMDRDINLSIKASSAARSAILLIFAMIAPFVIINQKFIKNIIDKHGLEKESVPHGMVEILANIAGTTHGAITAFILFLVFYMSYIVIAKRRTKNMLSKEGVLHFFITITQDSRKGYCLAFLVISGGIISVGYLVFRTLTM